VQGKAPTFTPDSSAIPWPNPAFDVRYWSLCNNEDMSPYPVVVVTNPHTQGQIFGCSADLDTPVVNGRYTYVLLAVADRPPNATTAHGVAWLPYGDQMANGQLVPQVLLWRNVLGNGFAHSVQKVPQDGSPASAHEVMDPYYPRVAQCSVATFTHGRASCVLRRRPGPPAGGRSLPRSHPINPPSVSGRRACGAANPCGERAAVQHRQ
ncbi:MAG: hypothetical protein JOZ81_27170, partial [Chloroflexi bacterium]|nr:hypothetical protein [Chloroflexota bacterium]